MNYELAKELKDAGFPMKRFGEVRVKHTEEGVETDSQYGYPTLSELIEACGSHDHFNLSYTKKDGHWQSVVGHALEPSPNHNNNYQADEVGDGTTEEEAVARLWLALNKKT